MHVGIDEAGKGPALGPMVAAAVRADPAALPAAVDDSKRLSPERREALSEAIRDAARAVGVAAIEPARIDDPATDMNSLTVAAHVEAATGVVASGDIVVADAGDVSESRFARRVREGLDGAGAAGGTTVEVRAEHRADERYPLVAVASIVAKVERDRRVDAIADALGVDVGSGYPSDPTTRTFLREYVDSHGRLPDCARASWKTCEDVLRAAAQSSLDEF